MYYYKQFYNNDLSSIITCSQKLIDEENGVVTTIEITESEYDSLLEELRSKPPDDIPEESEYITGDEFMQMVEAIL